MPFKQVFERRMNRNMQSNEPLPTPRNGPDGNDDDDADIKHGLGIKDDEFEEEDIEISEKKDRPPRFSTLFAPPAPRVVERYVEPKKRSGVYLPTPLFIVLAIILFFESTLLFAYTIIGLYNNLPHGLVPFGSSTTAVMGACNCAGQQQQPSINIAPNFIMGAANADPVTIPTGIPALSDLATTTTSSPTKSTTSSTSTKSTSTTSLDTTAAVAGLMSALRGIETSPTKNPHVASTLVVVTSTPPQKTVLSTLDLTVTPPLTSTSFVDVPAPGTTNSKRESPASAAPSKETGDAKAELSTLVTSTVPATLKTTDTPSPTKDNTTAEDKTTTAKASGTNGACFGAAGAVFQVCT